MIFLEHNFNIKIHVCLNGLCGQSPGDLKYNLGSKGETFKKSSILEPAIKCVWQESSI